MTHHHDPATDLTRPGIDADPTTSASAAIGASLDTAEPLAAIRRTETIADRVDFDVVRGELPDEWTVKPDLVQFGDEALAETVQFHRTIADPRLVLKPIDPEDPAGEIEFYERSGPRASRRPMMTVEPLGDALRVAINRVHQLE